MKMAIILVVIVLMFCMNVASFLFNVTGMISLIPLGVEIILLVIKLVIELALYFIEKFRTK